MNQQPITTDPAALAASIADWWALAGMDVAVQDTPRDWLTRAHPVAASVPILFTETIAEDIAPPSPAPPSHVAIPIPNDLDDFLAWLANDSDQPEAAFSSTRILPRAEAQPDMLVITDMPTQDDIRAGELFSGSDAIMLSAIARALGMDMDKIAMASLLLARPPGGIVEEAVMRNATSRMRHYCRLLRPRGVVLFGDGTNRAFGQTSGDMNGLSTHSINLDDGTIAAIALPAPFVLRKHPERKAAAWALLRQMAKR